MKTSSTGFLSSRLGRRMLALFVICALGPISVLTLVSLWATRGSLEEQRFDQLHEVNKTLGMSVLERLLFGETELRLIADNLRQGGTLVGLHEFLERFDALALLRHGAAQVRTGDAFALGDLTEEARSRLSEGGVVLTMASDSAGAARAALVMALDPARLESGLLAGAMAPDYGWGESLFAGLPAATDMVVHTPSGGVLGATAQQDLVRAAVAAVRRPGDQLLEHAGTTYLLSAWDLPLQFHFAADGIGFLTLRPRSSALAAANGFGRSYSLVALAMFWLVLLVSIAQIRRSVGPLQQLREGTRRLGEGDFSVPVQVSSGDEFEELAGAFNQMSSKIARQFNHLATAAKIDRAILSSVQVETIIAATVSTMMDGYECVDAGVGLVDSDRHVIRVTAAGVANGELRERLEPATEEMLLGESAAIFEPHRPAPPFVRRLLRGQGSTCVVAPVAVAGRLRAVLVLVLALERPVSRDELAQLRQTADQLAVALSNADLVSALQDMKKGALLAFARAVDAKSSWTTGHSERVTALAVRIGKEMGLGPDDVERLERGGLLHDIGKIGVSNEVLDKPGRLTAAEYEEMKRHPSIGARILEPLTAYADVLPIVLQHHERIDGKGYPHGLRGEEIHPLARVTAVADVFDACASDRPYRPGMPLTEVLGIIREGAGTQFDPEPAAALERVLAADPQAYTRLQAA